MMNIPFSPPDITEEEINEVVDTLRSGWITTKRDWGFLPYREGGLSQFRYGISGTVPENPGCRTGR